MSFSGLIRTTLATLKRHLIIRKDAGVTILDEDLTGATPTDVVDYIERAQDAQEDIKSTLKKFTDKLHEWVTLATTLSDPSDRDAEQAHYENVSDTYLDLVSECEDVITNLERKLRRLVPPGPTLGSAGGYGPSGVSSAQLQVQQPTIQAASQPATHQQSVAHRTTPIKPPRINLPVFNGDSLEYKQWMGLFKHNVHERTDLTNIEKFTCLVDKLGPKAKAAIEGLNIEEATYDIAIDLLNDRFDRAAERMISMLYSELNKVGNAKDSTSSKQDTLDACERILRQLEASGENVNSNRSLTIQVLGKFPASMIRDLQRYQHVGPNSTLHEVRKGIRDWLAECEATDAVISDLQAMKVSSNEGPSRQTQQTRQPIRDHYEPIERVYENSALASMPADRRPTPVQPRRPQMLEPPTECYFCQGTHFNSACDVYTSAKARQKRLAELKRCTRCMKRHELWGGGRCPVPIKCIKCGTNESHATALCYKTYPLFADGGAERARADDRHDDNLRDTASGGLTALNTNASTRPALFQTAKTMIVNRETGARIEVRLAMDTLSSRSFIRDAVAKKLNLKGTDDGNLFVSVFGTNRTLELATSLVYFDIMLRDGSTVEVSANTTNVICRSGALPTGWTSRESRVLHALQDSLADDPFDPNDTIDVLVGANLVWEFIRGARLPTESPNLFVIPSKFGLLLSGESEYQSNERSAPTLLCLTESPCKFPSELGLVACESKSQPQYPDIDEFWDLEKIGIVDDPSVNEDDTAIEIFKNSVSFAENRYQVRWPFIPEKVALLPTNYDTSYNRLRGLAKRLKTNDSILHGYREVIRTQVDNEIIERVPDDELSTTNRVHYLPHHPVVKESSETTKIRIVYDAGSKSDKKSVSLNECLMRGPVILPDLCHVLMRMRTHEIVVIADIEKAFLQISLHPDDRDTTRFLWFKNDTNVSLADNIAVYRFRRIIFGAKSSPSLLAVTIDHHLTNEGTPFAEQLKDDTFVDNVFHGMNGLDKSIECYHAMKAIFQRAGMNIQEFCSNSPRLMEFLPKGDAMKRTDAKFLGLRWDSQNDDTLRLISSGQEADTLVTKRRILQAVASVFDPLGLYQPVLLPSKLLLQKLWDLKYDWDDRVNDELNAEWQELRASLARLSSHRVPRFIGRTDRPFTLAVFCDASKKAYATSVYLRCQLADGGWQSNLIFAKSRLAPKANKRKDGDPGITLPRLELLGVVIGTRAADFCRKGLKATDAEIDLFCDSECVHHWIRSPGLTKRFVSRRVEEIRLLKNCKFHFVGTADNPADLSTRGKTADELFTCEEWWHGPTWLSKDQAEWPRRNIAPIDDSELQELQDVKPAYVTHTLIANANDHHPASYHFLGLDPAAISTLNKLTRVSAICLKFLKITIWNRLSDATKQAKPVLRSIFDDVSDGDVITSSDCEVSKKQWVRCVQHSHYADVLQNMLSEQHTKLQPIVGQLGLKVDSEGLIRTCGRLEHADLPEAARAPYLLPPKDRFSTLVIEAVHAQLMHAGVSHTLSVLRQEFWIVHGRSAVRHAIRPCRVCKIFKTGKPFRLPAMPPLPETRLSQAVPFQFTGLDYFGPITVTVHQEHVKMWVCLFTCMVIRAVHLEPVMDCSAVEFLHALTRFISRRGVPQCLTSDNAAQFHLIKILGDQAWKRTPRDDAITSYTAEHGITWRFITELAPWQGGFYERLVGLVKSTLRTSIKRKMLTWTDLVTLLAEAEAVVNSRPITYVADDPDSRYRVLRPSDFLVSAPTSVDSAEEVKIRSKNFGEAGKRVLAVWKKRKNTLQCLWKCWQEEYLTNLRERPITAHPSGRSDVTTPPKENHVVLIYDPDLPRGRWRTARITKLVRSSDGHVRSAEVQLPNGTTLRRPINLLIPLEIDCAPAEGGPDGAATQDTAVDDTISDEDAFLGFTADDVQRTTKALTWFDNGVRQAGTAPTEPGSDDE